MLSNSSIDVMIIPGTDVRDGTQTVKNELTELWHAAFPDDPDHDPKVGIESGKLLVNADDYSQDTFCIVCDDSTENHEIIGAGRLRPVTINHKETTYEILGVSDIAVKAKSRNRGIGRQLVTKLAKHSKSQDMAAVGFCSSANSEFYQKCGFEVLKGAVKRFKYVKPDGTLLENSFDEDVFFIRGDGEFADNILSTNDEIILQRPHW
eukprot:TRINITY_DN19400_c0_g1_i1.p1 TRINITY_DN19400_c0_g1~~TRINITY_DN19400_c0_g1_i1.p1  ORF type:complete len:207 (+),score=34.65 TRINITY_DN19400_c0_g1_i1:36-656(+)